MAGDFDGDGFADITWYAPGAAGDYVWWGQASGFRSSPVRIDGTYEPVAGDFNGDIYDDILFYGLGSSTDSMVFGGPDGHLP